MLAYEAGRLTVCQNGSKISKTILPTTLAALVWLGGAVFPVKQLHKLAHITITKSIEICTYYLPSK